MSRELELTFLCSSETVETHFSNFATYSGFTISEIIYVLSERTLTYLEVAFVGNLFESVLSNYGLHEAFLVPLVEELIAREALHFLSFLHQLKLPLPLFLCLRLVDKHFASK